jgi:hypothetical protein
LKGGERKNLNKKKRGGNEDMGRGENEKLCFFEKYGGESEM